jgi:hypothetical protein
MTRLHNDRDSITTGEVERIVGIMIDLVPGRTKVRLGITADGSDFDWLTNIGKWVRPKAGFKVSRYASQSNLNRWLEDIPASVLNFSVDLSHLDGKGYIDASDIYIWKTTDDYYLVKDSGGKISWRYAVCDDLIGLRKYLEHIIPTE